MQSAEKLHTSKFIISLLALGTACIFLLCLFMSGHEFRIIEKDRSELPESLVSDDIYGYLEEAFYSVDPIEGCKIRISGWLVISGTPASRTAIRTVLRNRDTDKYYQLPTRMQERTDVTEQFYDGLNYDNSGFVSYLDANGLDPENNTYDILIRYDINGRSYLIDTGGILSKNE